MLVRLTVILQFNRLTLIFEVIIYEFSFGRDNLIVYTQVNKTEALYILVLEWYEILISYLQIRHYAYEA